MSKIEKRLQELGIVLEGPKAPVGNYLGCKRIGELLFVSGRVSDLRGEVGSDVSEEEARAAARETIILILSIIKSEIGNLDQIIGVVKLQGFIRSAPGFINQPKVLDGASGLLIELLGEEGRHARTAMGVAQLPFGATLQLDLVLQVLV